MLPTTSATATSPSTGSDETIDSSGLKSIAGAIGLSDPRFSTARRKLLDLINRLHNTGVQRDVDLPVIAVIGNQSAGKSSLIESISGITLPRASGTCTRCPTECRLTWSTQPWQCIVSLRFITDERGQALGHARNESFGEVIFEKAKVEERIRRAQRAALNPSTRPIQFLQGADADPAHPELSFTTNCVCLQIRGSDVADLSFCDLPGLISSVGKGGKESDIGLITSLVTSYISKPSCIILLTVACETDFENQGAHHIAKQHDPEGKRTIGVLTKPDPRWTRFIKNECEPLENGWFSVKQPDSKALASGITWEDARQMEREYFASASVWSELEPEFQRYLGTTNLTERLSQILSELIAKRLPELQDELQSLLHKTEEALRQLPKPPSNDAFAEILHILSDFARDMSKHLEGTPEGHGLLQTLRPIQERFKKAIRETAPDFRPSPRPARASAASRSDDIVYDSDEEPSEARFQQPEFLRAEEPDAWKVKNDDRAVYVDEVMARAREATTRELPDYYPFVVIQQYINAVTLKWDIPTKNLFDSVQNILTTYVKQIINQHFSKFTQGGLHQHVIAVVNEHIKERCAETIKKVLWLLELEQQPCTLNGHYYSDYRDKFVSHYRAHRSSSGSGSLLTKLGEYPGTNSANRQTEFQKNTAQVLSGLSAIGISGVKATDLPKLLPSDPYEPALNIMACVRAYFQVAYKRYVDYVPMAVDRELILGLDMDGALESVLLKGLGITGPDGPRRCKEFLQEPPNVVTRRQELQKRWERLDTAKKELMDIWL
ncbi:P-loop containing nucleoside triphosphate hydrolase protein [Fomitopsis serialis]|uniref:P-loop containing nucleoside triphosphate hydrolase protein n=1 Tax=Fomitopsis serialis TaxID=139415 RepID=UPI002008CE74|nr:P-loop containing nucleoside triphosphate hydrolase protein [Neoantrodia serialis]KAH9915501.1 P-loop containing nucleoside triphosphate hydrolase protein [Neoantrodia serialis]